MNKQYNELYNFISNEKNSAEQFVLEMKRKNIHKIYLFGGGQAAEWYYKFLLENKLMPIGIIDRDYKLVKNHMGLDMKTIRLSDICENIDVENTYVVVTSLKYRKEIREELLNVLPESHVYCFECELYINKMIKNVDEYRQYLLQNWDDIVACINEYEDDYSRQTFINVIKGRISGNVDYFDNVMDTHQRLSDDLINLHDNETICDCGSFNGDSLLDFSNRLRNCKDGKVVCFEPDKSIFQSLSEQAKSIYGIKIVLVNKAVHASSGVLYMNLFGGDGTSTISNEGDYLIDAVSLDDFMSDEHVSLIKMDIEGSELDALKGGQKIITRDKPRLAICVYHKYEDFIDIQKYIKGIVPEYKFYLRHHNYAGPDTVLYAICNK